MAKKKIQSDPSEYGKYRQLAFRVSEAQQERFQTELEALYEKFNKGRDSKNPKGRKAVKVRDIALKALDIGISALQKQTKWNFSED